MSSAAVPFRRFPVAGFALGLAFSCLCAPRPVAGQDPPALPGFGLSLQSGGAAFSAFRNQIVRARRPSTAEERIFEQALAAETTVALSLTMHYWRPRWGLRLGSTYAPSSFVQRREERDRAFLMGDTEEESEPQFADLSVWLLDASFLLQLPSRFGRFHPYGILGGGAVIYRARERRGSPLPVGAREALADGALIHPALVVGVGGLIPLRSGLLSLSFELVDHITGTPFDAAEASRLEQEDLIVEVDPPGLEDPTGLRLVNHVRFLAGVSFALRAGDGQ